MLHDVERIQFARERYEEHVQGMSMGRAFYSAVKDVRERYRTDFGVAVSVAHRALPEFDGVDIRG